MLEKFGIDIKGIRNNSKVLASFRQAGVGGVEVTDADLKCKPKSDFIYNDDIMTYSYLEGLSNSDKNDLVIKLQRENEAVRRDNEQFRQKNFSMYLELRKLEKAKNDE